MSPRVCGHHISNGTQADLVFVCIVSQSIIVHNSIHVVLMHMVITTYTPKVTAFVNFEVDHQRNFLCIYHCSIVVCILLSVLLMQHVCV